MNWISDVCVVLGFAAANAGLYLLAGPAWTLLAGGSCLCAFGVFVAARRSGRSEP